MIVAVAALAGVLLAAGLIDLAAVVVVRRAAAPTRTTTFARGGSYAARGVAVLVRLGRRLGVPAPPGDLGARLAAAGLGASVRTTDAMAVKAYLEAVHQALMEARPSVVAITAVVSAPVEKIRNLYRYHLRLRAAAQTGRRQIQKRHSGLRS